MTSGSSPGFSYHLHKFKGWVQIWGLKACLVLLQQGPVVKWKCMWDHWIKEKWEATEGGAGLLRSSTFSLLSVPQGLHDLCSQLWNTSGNCSLDKCRVRCLWCSRRPSPSWKHLAILQGGAGCTDVNFRPLRLWGSHLLSTEGAGRTSLRQFLSKLNDNAEAVSTPAKPGVSHYSWGSRNDQS